MAHTEAVNKSQDVTIWQEDGKTYQEVIRQGYLPNADISAGFVEGAGVDTMYIRFEKFERMYLLRPDEMAALAWCAAGVLWSQHIADVEPVTE